MVKKNKLQGLIDNDNLDIWLSVSGYAFPRNETELDLFDELYKNYECKNKNIRINPSEIINGTFQKKGKTINLIEKENNTEINNLRLAARKGNQNISDEILNKMKSKHNNKDGN